MAMMGKSHFSFRILISQVRGIFIITNSIFALDSLKKYGYESWSQWITPMVRVHNGMRIKKERVDPSTIGVMIGTLLYLTANPVSLLQGHVENGVIELYFVNTEYQLADIFTKALGRERIEFLINKLGMRSFTPDTLKQLADEVDE
ncbi:hypothetical protein Tco_0217934 [Tanacetum coccineum]